MNQLNLIGQYHAELAEKKRALFDLYRGEDIRPKHKARGNGWTWGYRLFVDGVSATGASIGEDEIKLFFDLPNLVQARYAYTVGVAFGLSTFNLALSREGIRVFAIDNYSKGTRQETDHAQRLVERLARERVSNVSLHVGSSPAEVEACLRGLPAGEKLSIVFIDGLHTDAAAAADFAGIRPYIDASTVVLWHNTYKVRRAFEESFAGQPFDRRLVLRTFGVLGVYFNSAAHPALEPYLRDNCLIWHDWEAHLRQLEERPRLGAPIPGAVAALARRFLPAR